MELGGELVSSPVQEAELAPNVREGKNYLFNEETCDGRVPAEAAGHHPFLYQVASVDGSKMTARSM